MIAKTSWTWKAMESVTARAIWARVGAEGDPGEQRARVGLANGRAEADEGAARSRTAAASAVCGEIGQRLHIGQAEHVGHPGQDRAATRMLPSKA